MVTRAPTTSHSMRACLSRELVAAARTGNQQALEGVIECSYSGIRSILAHLSGDDELALDLAQETFVVVAREIGHLAQVERCMPWLYQIARNQYFASQRPRWLKRLTSLDRLRDQRPDHSALIDGEPLLDAYIEKEHVHQVLAALEPDGREILYLRHLADCNAAEIANLLKLSPSPAQRRLNRAEARFRDKYSAR